MTSVPAASRRSLFGEMARFGAVGVAALAVDVVGFNLLRFAGGEGPLYDRPLTAKIVSVTASTAVAYLGNRLWTFRRQRSAIAAMHREFTLFVLFSAVALGIAVACLAVSHYALGFTGPVADNIAANVVGLGLATAFRFWSYRRWVFT